MEPNWFGMMMVLGFIAAGTLVFVLTYKLLAVLARLIFPKKFNETPSSQNATPLDLVGVLVALFFVLVLPVYVVTSEANLENGGMVFMLWLSVIAVAIYADKKLRSVESIKTSWWCTPIGEKNSQKS